MHKGKTLGLAPGLVVGASGSAMSSSMAGDEGMWPRVSGQLWSYCQHLNSNAWLRSDDAADSWPVLASLRSWGSNEPPSLLVLKSQITQDTLGSFSMGKWDLGVVILLYFQENVNKPANVIFDLGFKWRRLMSRWALKALQSNFYFRVL